MCLLIFAHRVHTGFPLMVAANRDEFHNRPTSPSEFWPSYPSLLAGRDEQMGGTWMGVTRGGRFAAVTNFRDPAATGPAPRSRGELTLDYLVADKSPECYLHTVSQRADEYAGFNLLLGDALDLWYFSNSAQQGGLHNSAPMKLEPGVYGLSNALLDTPWPKVVTGKQKLEEMLGEANEPTHESLLGLINSPQLADPGQLQTMGMETPMEQVLSAQFIRSKAYGTRSSTTLWKSNQGSMSWRELSFDSRGEPSGSREENFQHT